MEVRSPRVGRVQSIEVGSLFVLLGGARGNPICLRAAYNAADDPDEANRVVPLHWPEDRQSVGVAIYATALSGWGVVLDDARLAVSPLSARSGEVESLTAVYARDGRLFFPVSYQGRLRGLVDAESGEILTSVSGTYVIFEDWYISIAPAQLDRLVVLPVSDENESENG